MKSVLLTTLFIIFLALNAAIGALMIFRNDPDVQAWILSFALDREIALEGEMQIGLNFNQFSFGLKDYTATEKESGDVLLKFKDGQISIPFWEWIGGARRFNMLQITSGYTNIYDSFKPIYIDSAQKTETGWTAQGRIGPHSYSIQKSGKDVALSLADITASGFFAKGLSRIENINLTAPNTPTITGTFQRRGNGFDVHINPKDRQPLDIRYREKSNLDKISVETLSLHYEEVAAMIAVGNRFYTLWKDITQPDTKTQQTASADRLYKVTIDEFYKNEVLLGRLDFEVEDNPEQIYIRPINTRIAGAALKGDMAFPRKKEDKRDIAVSLENFDYLTLLQAFGTKLPVDDTGQADLKIRISLDGENFEEWKKSARGSIHLTANEASFDARLINLWGGGLVSYLIPSFDQDQNTRLECAALDMFIEDGMAQIKPVVLNTQRVIIYGKGDYNLMDNTINLVLKPKNKGIALGDIASNLEVSGKITNPSIRPNMISALRKVGEIALGTINPAFYLFSLADLGLTESNPCQTDAAASAS